MTPTNQKRILLARPPSGWAHEQPGYTFSLQPVWPPDFVPQDHKSVPNHSAISRANREARLAKGETETMFGGLSSKSAGVRDDVSKAAVKR